MVEQIDRDAAAEEVYEREKGNLAWPYARSTCDRILSGDWDHHPTVQRYARHRLAALSARPAGDYVLVREIETVTGDFCTEPGEPFYRIEIDGFCADFDYREAADNFAAAINARIAARPAVAEDVVERVAEAIWKRRQQIAWEGGEQPVLWHYAPASKKFLVREDARVAIAAMGSADMGKGGEG